MKFANMTREAKELASKKALYALIVLTKGCSIPHNRTSIHKVKIDEGTYFTPSVILSRIPERKHYSHGSIGRGDIQNLLSPYIEKGMIKTATITSSEFPIIGFPHSKEGYRVDLSRLEEIPMIYF